MIQQPLTIICFILVLCCMATGKAPKKCYRKTKVVLAGYWQGKFTNHYFKLREGNYFDHYVRIMGLSKIEHHMGSYTQRGDTLLLDFCGAGIPEDYTGKAFIDNANKQIILFSEDPSFDEEFGFRKDKR